MEDKVTDFPLVLIGFGVKLVRGYFGLETAQLSEVMLHVCGQNGTHHGLPHFSVLSLGHGRRIVKLVLPHNGESSGHVVVL